MSTLPDIEYFRATDYIINPAQVAMMRDFIDDGDIVFDVGANRGFWTYKLAQADKHPSLLYLFEPTPLIDIADKLSVSFPDTDYRRFQVAVGSQIANDMPFIFYDQPVGFSRFGDGSTSSSFHIENMDASFFVEEHKTIIHVDVTTIDAAMEEIPFVHYIKVDTELHDLHVILGARNALEHKRIGVLEFEHAPGALINLPITLEEMFVFIEPNYTFGYLNVDSVVWVDSPHDLNWDVQGQFVLKLKDYKNG